MQGLENVLIKGIALSHGDTFTPDLLPDFIRTISSGHESQAMEKAHVAHR